MKSLTVVIAIIISISSYAQQSVVLKISYKPGKTYRTEIKTDVDTELNFDGDQETMEKMKANGATFPLKIKGKSENVSTSVTGNSLPDGRIPVKMTFDKMNSVNTINEKESVTPNPLEGAVLQGHFDTKGQLKLDSLVGGSLEPAVEEALLALVEKLQQAVVFPEKSLKVGDSFQQTVPVDLPLPGMAMKAEVNTNYLLRSIDKGFAKFDIKQTMTLVSDIPNAKMDLTGGGDGTVDFDISNSIMSNFTTSMDMILNMEIQGMKIFATSKAITNQVVSLVK